LLEEKDGYVKTKERWKILKDYFNENDIDFKEIHSVLRSILSKMINLIYLLDYSTIYHAVILGIDHSPIKSIDFVKSRLLSKLQNKHSKIFRETSKVLTMFEGKKILITGGTGSLGTNLTKKLLTTDVDTIRIFSRDELKQEQMKSSLKDKRLRFFIGDVRDKQRVSRALEDIDILIHAAALKHISIIEYNPFEAVKTNVYGAQNIIESCLDNDVEIAVGIGTDKAVSPFNTYGATKFLMERLFRSSNFAKGKHRTKFFCVRYGNVLGSRGSVLKIFLEQIKKGEKITITDPNMTRFNITMSQALELIFRTLKNSIGGEVFIPKLKAYRLSDLTDAVLELTGSNNEAEIISVRPGEKFHEILISKDELRDTYETKNDYVIFEEKMLVNYSIDDAGFSKTNLKEEYSSDRAELLSKNELKRIITNENLIP